VRTGIAVTISTVSIRRFHRTGLGTCRGASALDETRSVLSHGSLSNSDIEQMRMGVLEHLGIAQAPSVVFAAELREGTVVRLLTDLERTVPIRCAYAAAPTTVRQSSPLSSRSISEEDFLALSVHPLIQLISRGQVFGPGSR